MKKRERKRYEIKGQTHQVFYKYAAQANLQSVVFGIDGMPTQYGYANGGFTQEVKPGIFVKVGEGTQAMLRRQRKAGVVFVGSEVEPLLSVKQKAKLTEAISKRQEAGEAYKLELEARQREREETQKKRSLAIS